MATVPRVTRRVFTDAMPGVRKTAADTALSLGAGVEEAKERKGAQIAQFGQQLGRVGEQFAEIAIEERKTADETAIFESDNLLSSFENKALYDPETGALSKRGKDAQGIPEQVIGEFNKEADRVQATLQPGRQQDAFAKLRLRREAQLDATLRRHQLGEMQRYQVGELKALVENKRDSAIANANDPRRVGEDLKDAVSAIRIQGPRLGMSPEEIDQQVAATRADAYAGIIDRLVTGGNVKAAKAYYEEVGKELNGKAQAEIEKRLKAGTIRQEAQTATEKILGEHPDDFAAQRKAAKDLGGEVGDEVLQRIEHEQALKDREEADQRHEWNVTARNILDKTGDWRQLEKLPFWDRLNTAEVSAIRTYAEHRVRKVPVDTVPSVYYNLVQKATSDNPKDRAEFFDPKKTNLMELVDKLSESDWQMFVRMQTSGAGQLEKEQHALLVNAANQNRIVDEAIVGMGFDPRPVDDPTNTKKFSAEQIAFVNDFRRQVREAVQTLEQTRAGKGALATATDDEVQAIVDRMRIPIGKSARMKEDGWFTNTYYDKFAWEVKAFEDIPVATREEIKRSIYAKGGTVSKDLVLSMYRARLAGVK